MQARLADVPLRYVKGHSGDPDNDRVDQIAVAYSKGTAPHLKQGSRSTPVKAVDPRLLTRPLPMRRHQQRCSSC